MSYFRQYESPLGQMLLVANERALTGVYFEGQRYHPVWDPAWKDGARVEVLDQAVEELEGYFRGTLQRFATPLEPRGTEFQRRVWEGIRGVEFGETVSYTELARRSGCGESSVRAVGAANGRNRISLIIPCHRIIGASGDLTGYAGGLDRKRRLLLHEGAAVMSAETGTQLPSSSARMPAMGTCTQLGLLSNS